MMHIHVNIHVYKITQVKCTIFAGAPQAFESSFNDTRCTDGTGVCPAGPVLFTCHGTNVTTLIRVTVPSGDELILTSSNRTIGIPPAGITVAGHNVVNNVNSYDYELSLVIESVSQLNSEPIFCDGGSSIDQVMAECSLIGEYKYDFLIMSSKVVCVYISCV